MDTVFFSGEATRGEFVGFFPSEACLTLFYKGLYKSYLLPILSKQILSSGAQCHRHKVTGHQSAQSTGSREESLQLRVKQIGLGDGNGLYSNQ